MGEGLKQMFCEVSSSRARGAEEASGSSSPSEDSDHGSISSASSGDDEAASPRRPRWPSSPVSHLGSEGPLHELSSLVAQLPIKKGLSKYYQGKSQSFTSLSDVRSLEDLPKKETPYRKKVKSCKSYAGGLDEAQRKNKSNKSPRDSSSSCASLVARSSSTSFLCGKPPAMPMHRNH